MPDSCSLRFPPSSDIHHAPLSHPMRRKIRDPEGIIQRKEEQAPAAHNLHHAKDEGRQVLLTTRSVSPHLRTQRNQIETQIKQFCKKQK